ncbi:MAG: hypothetical protein H0U73_05740 [Tatlockia sp.]|nr:hypothetical protein [Tatlockia sp.]
MSEKEEQIKKKLAEEMRNKEIAQFDQEAVLKKAASDAAINEALAEEDETSALTSQDECYFKPKISNANKDDWKDILDDYEELFKDRLPLKGNVLVFKSPEEAIAFFEKHATASPPRKFLCPEVDINHKLTGYNLYSCGSNKLYKGTFQQIHNEITADLKAKPDDPNLQAGLAEITRHMNPTSGFKAAFKEVVPKTEEEEQVAKSSLPDPTSTKPKSPLG